MSTDDVSSPDVGREFAWTPEHHQLRQVVKRMMTDLAPVSRAREVGEAGGRLDPRVWSALRDAGLLGLGLPEDVGGVGGGLVDLAILGEELGRVLHGGPFLSSSVLATHALLAAEEHEVLAAVLAGDVVATLAPGGDGQWGPEHVTAQVRSQGDQLVLNGSTGPVLDGVEADLLLVPAREQDGVSLFAVAGEAGVTRTALVPLDLTRPTARLSFRDASVRRIGPAGAGWRAVESALCAGRIYLAAEQVGGSAHAVEATTEYARTRHQFGRPIGSFQGVKHRLADMTVRTELARSAAYWAAWRADAGDQGDALVSSVCIASSYCSEAFVQTALDMIQLHGGIGFTWEHDAHLFLRRARSTMTLLGRPQDHRRRLLDALLQEAAL